MTLKNDERFPVDRRALDEQWEQQPALFLEYAEELAAANALVDEWKDELEKRKAELDPEVRAELSKSGKVTEAMVASAISQDGHMVTIQTELREAQKRAAFYKAEVQALEHRKAALENLVKLHGQEYFSVPITTIADRTAHNTTKARTAIRSAMTRKPKGA